MPRAHLPRHPRQEALREGPRTSGRTRGSDRTRADRDMCRCQAFAAPYDRDSRSPRGWDSGNGRDGVVPARAISSFLSSIPFNTLAGGRATPDAVVVVPTCATKDRKSHADSGALASLRHPFISS